MTCAWLERAMTLSYSLFVCQNIICEDIRFYIYFFLLNAIQNIRNHETTWGKVAEGFSWPTALSSVFDITSDHKLFGSRWKPICRGLISVKAHHSPFLISPSHPILLTPFPAFLASLCHPRLSVHMPLLRHYLGYLSLGYCSQTVDCSPSHNPTFPSPDMNHDTLISFDRRRGCHHNPCCLDFLLITST